MHNSSQQRLHSKSFRDSSGLVPLQLCEVLNYNFSEPVWLKDWLMMIMVNDMMQIHDSGMQKLFHKKKKESLTSSRWIIYMVLICIIPQFSSIERSGSTDPAVFCLCMYTLATLALYCGSVLAVSVCVLHLVSCYCEWIFNEAMASSTPVLLGSESVENSLCLSHLLESVKKAWNPRPHFPSAASFTPLCTAVSRAHWQPGQTAGDESGTINPAQ